MRSRYVQRACGHHLAAPLVLMFAARVHRWLLQIRVFCRVRPHPQSAVRCLAGGTGLSLALDNKEHSFNFDKVFGPGTQQQQVREAHLRPQGRHCEEVAADK